MANPHQEEAPGYALLIGAVMATFIFCIVLTLVLLIVSPP